MCIDISVLSGFIIVKKYLSQRVADTYFLLAMLFMPLYIFPLIMYTDPLAVLFLSLGMLFFSKVNIKKYKLLSNIGLLLISSILFLIATFIKTNSIIMIIAMILVIICGTDINFKRKILVFVCIFVSIIFFSKWKKKYKISTFLSM